jgi:hypothetical protein
MSTLEALKPYVEQLLDDDAVQRDLSRAARNLRGARARAGRAKSKKRAAVDPQLYRWLAAGVGAALDASVAVKEGPKKKARRRRRGRGLLLLAVAGGAAYVATNEQARTTLLELAGRAQPEPGHPAGT